MAEMPWEHAAEARAALNAIVTDPEHGAQVLSSPKTMSNLLKDLLPDAPREKNLLVAAAEAGLAGSSPDRKSTRLNSSHQIISYAVFCLKKKIRVGSTAALIARRQQ